MSAQALFNSLSGSDALSPSRLFDVSGWVAVVTGGGTGLGLVTATTLADNGCKVYITGRREQPLQEAVTAYKARKSSAGAGGEIIAIQADVSTKDGITRFKKEIETREQYINVLINNHGVSLGASDINACEQTPAGLSEQMFAKESFESWLDTYKINTASYHFTTFAFLPLLAAAKTVGGAAEPGNVINLSSMSGITNTSQRGQFNYNASKQVAATILLSRMQATEFARRDFGIRVNCICPGYFPSGMTVIPAENNTGSEAHRNEFRKHWGIPFARPGSARDYAQCILSTVSNQYMTGADIVIDGGWLLETAF